MSQRFTTCCGIILWGWIHKNPIYIVSGGGGGGGGGGTTEDPDEECQFQSCKLYNIIILRGCLSFFLFWLLVLGFLVRNVLWLETQSVLSNGEKNVGIWKSIAIAFAIVIRNMGIRVCKTGFERGT
jgi:hypothetical protein